MALAKTGDALIVPNRGRPAPTARSASAGLPDDILSQAAARLSLVAFVYAFMFFMAGFVPPLLFDRETLFGSVLAWLPGVLAIPVALAVALVARSGRVDAARVITLGLWFEVVSSYGIAAAEFFDRARLANYKTFLGLSWVAVWIVCFTVVVPTRPRRAIVAALASVSSIPVVVGIAMATVRPWFRPDPFEFFFWFIFPYLLVVLVSSICARVVYGLGTEVTRARELGSYKLVERLGQGGMGEVWRAEHRLLARPAAIKLIRPSPNGHSRDGASPDAVRRFEREAQVTASLRSPHTVNLFDFGVAGDGSFYYVMELLEGLDLDTLVRRHGPLSAERVIYILRQICHSLSEAESHALVHRDIKPANIFLCRYGEDFDFVKVLDFGIVKSARDGGADTAMTLTVANVIHGTPAYIAPEQALNAGNIDGRADIYSTGCVAYWMLTAQHVFEGENTVALLMHHAQTPPIPPSQRTELFVPPKLDALVLACLAKQPEDRPQSARDLLRRLDCLDVDRTWTEDQARAWWLQHESARPSA
jgi:hypothetical protein